MEKRYVILSIENGWVENIVIWDGITEFTLPEGTIIKLESEIDYSKLPPNPNR